MYALRGELLSAKSGKQTPGDKNDAAMFGCSQASQSLLGQRRRGISTTYLLHFWIQLKSCHISEKKKKSNHEGCV